MIKFVGLQYPSTSVIHRLIKKKKKSFCYNNYNDYNKKRFSKQRIQKNSVHKSHIIAPLSAAYFTGLYYLLYYMYQILILELLKSFILFINHYLSGKMNRDQNVRS